MLEAYRKLKTKPKQSPKSRKRFKLSGTTPTCHRDPIDKAVKNFSKRLTACVGAGGGHFEHSVTTKFWHDI